jgi:hypothetical protein
MKITLTIDIFGELETAREHRQQIRQVVCQVLADQIQRDRETQDESIVSAQDKEIGSVSCSAVYAEASP